MKRQVAYHRKPRISAANTALTNSYVDVTIENTDNLLNRISRGVGRRRLLDSTNREVHGILDAVLGAISHEVFPPTNQWWLGDGRGGWRRKKRARSADA